MQMTVSNSAGGAAVLGHEGLTGTVSGDADHAHDHGHGHHPFQAHHFESMQHQFDAGKLGIWLFLITEVLFFSGLFCFYTIYRYNHPEIFQVGHHFLNKELGALNTIVLLFSSLTMAWGVRCAQLGQRQGLIWCLSLTLACAAIFMVVKYFEYSAKISHGTLWVGNFDPVSAAHYLDEHQGSHGGHSSATSDHGAAAHGESHSADEGGAAAGAASAADGHAGGATAASGKDHAEDGHAVEGVAAGDHGAGGEAKDAHASAGHTVKPLNQNVGIFFSIYFCLTGLHGLHIIGGMIAIGWLLWRAIRGDFGPSYFGPVDYVGLYWHLVDLIWIYLFPLLYLIGNHPV
jgi:cytochrome c oxidase subunit III